MKGDDPHGEIRKAQSHKAFQITIDINAKTWDEAVDLTKRALHAIKAGPERVRQTSFGYSGNEEALWITTRPPKSQTTTA